MGLRGRNNLKEESVFFVTTSVRNFVHVFKRQSNCEILVSNIKHYQRKYNFVILAYVIMHNHFHWIVFTDPVLGFISDIMRDLKKYSAWEIMENEGKINSEYLNLFFNPDRPNRKRQFWQHRFHDSAIRNNKMLWEKVKYIHDNPVKAGLAKRPELYKYSSARNYLLNDHSVLCVDTEFGGIDIR